MNVVALNANEREPSQLRLTILGAVRTVSNCFNNIVYTSVFLPDEFALRDALDVA